MISKDKFREKAIDRIAKSKGHCGAFRAGARDDYAFISGDQWVPEDTDLLNLQKRPVVTFNYSEKMIDAVGGAEVSNRQEVVYKPRGLEDAGLSELWTNAGRWVRDECNAEDEETDAFRDALICGMGWVETKMDYTEDKDGMPVMNRVDPTEMRWDTASIKPGLSDRRWDAHGEWMDNSEIRARWPRADIAESVADDNEYGFNTIRTGHRYEDDTNDGDDRDSRHTEQTMVWHYQCFELEPFYRVATGDGRIEEISAADFGAMRAQIDAFGLQYVKQMKKVYYRGFFAGDGEDDATLLEWGLSPCQAGFTRDAITGKRDRNRNQWYGLTRVMKDPQRWANKWLAQIMHIINSNAKGGLLAEQNAFVDPRKAQDEWAQPDSVTLLKEGGLGKVKEKQMTAYPSGLDRLMEFALNSLPQVTGINLEALGLADRDQANVLEQSRKQAAYGLLAPVFDSLRRYRKHQGKVMLFFIRNFISDGRLVRISGPGSEQWIPLTKAPDAVTFDIIIDASPTAPDVKQRTWDMLMQIAPALIKAGIPLPPDLLTYAPLPTGLIQKWQQFMMQQQQQQIPPQIQQQMQQMQDEIQKLNQQLQQEKSNNAADVMKAQTDQAKIVAQLQMEKHKQDAELALQAQKQNFDMQLQRHKAQGDLRIKAAATGAPVAIPEMESAAEPLVTDALRNITQEFSAALKDVVESLNRPKQVVRDQQGRVIGVE